MQSLQEVFDVVIEAGVYDPTKSIVLNLHVGENE